MPDERPLAETVEIETAREENADSLASPPESKHLSYPSDAIEDKQVESEQGTKSQDQALGTAGETEVTVSAPPEYPPDAPVDDTADKTAMDKKRHLSDDEAGKQKAMLREKKTCPGVSQYLQAKKAAPVVWRKGRRRYKDQRNRVKKTRSEL